MRLRNTLVQLRKPKSSDTSQNEQIVTHHKLEDFQDLSNSIDLSFQKILMSVAKNNSDLQSAYKQDKVYYSKTEPSKKDQFPSLFVPEDNTRLDYYKYTLKEDFLGFLEPQEARERIQMEAYPKRLTEDWIIKLKAKQAKRLLYQEEALGLKAEIEAVNRIRARLKIVDQIKQQKRRIIHHYFNS